MAERQLILTCSLTGSCDCTAVQMLLEQYGLEASSLGHGLIARGEVPVVLSRMLTVDIESHLTSRIEDAAPGTRVAAIKATLVRGVAH